MPHTEPFRRHRGSGFTLIEILVVLVVMFIIASIMIPLFLEAMQKAKQRRTMAEMHTIGKALMSWVTDQATAAAAGAGGARSIDVTDVPGPVDPETVLAELLTPQYVAEIPRFDAWRYPLEYYLDEKGLSIPGLMAIRSPGRDGTFDEDTYVVGPFDPTDYDQDIVWIDGYFARFPQGGSQP